MVIATFTSRGRVTVPREIREQLRLSPGDLIEIKPLGNGIFSVTPIVKSPKVHGGIAPQPTRHSSSQAMVRGKRSKI